jgi:type I restriction-modification system DNA methylase subunit
MIPQSFDEAFESVQQLVSRFYKNERQYLSSSYSEAQARQDFVDKFWIALGWDVHHDLQTNPYEQEVKVEHSVGLSEARRSAARKRADYAFLAPNFRDVRFYVEAKRPSAQIDTPDSYFQTIRYGWNSKTPLAILTNFQELRVLDCRYKPDIHTALQSVIRKSHCFDCTDEQKFKEIYYLLSRQAVNNGSIERFVENQLKATGRVQQKKLFNDAHLEIDESFLQELDKYREELAKMFKRENLHLTSEELTEATQRTLDRLVFLRFLEDKLIEPESLVEKLGDKVAAWKDFVSMSRKLNTIYNGIIFKAHPLIDNPSFNVDERTFVDICNNLAHVHSPYDFNTIPIHILGSIYERFLGKVIVATDKQADVKEKPEVRKAGGVYYTPEYVVRYIVANTVGKLIEGKPLDEVRQMRFADIACGSGSFLLGVYDLLLRHYTAYYNKNKRTRAEGIKAKCREHDDGTLHLSLWQRREILLNHIYGVDIDAQAVEVAQLSLYLKMLEDETTASAKSYQLELREALLPSLNKNIICGNSLIEWDILEGKLFETGEERKLNPMSFESAFPQIMKAGGFDAIVGNPPWGATLTEEELEYLRNKYRDIIVRMIDSFMYFVRCGSNLVKSNGSFGMILPDVVLYQKDNWKLREFLTSNFNLKNLLNMGDVFERVTRPASILIFEKSCSQKNPIIIGDFTKIKKADKSETILDTSRFQSILQKDLKEVPGNMFITSEPERYLIWKKVKLTPHRRLEEFLDEDGIQRGVSPDLKKAFLVDAETIEQCNLEKHKLKPTLTGGRQVKRYLIDYPQLWLIYTKHDENFQQIPCIRSYINLFRSEITCKEVSQKKHSLYSLHRPRNEQIFLKSEKILGVITEDEIIVALDDRQTYPTDGLYLFGVKREINPKYLMAILNSRLFVVIYRLLSSEEGRVLAQVKPTILSQLPIRTINFSDRADKARHDRTVQLVEQILTAKKQLAESRSDRDKIYYENKCAVLDRQVDQLVYELYGLTSEEIRLIEES